MGAGRIRVAPGKKVGKDGRRSKFKNDVANWLSPRNWWSCSSTVFLVGNAENDRAKNWIGHIFCCLTWSEGNGIPPLWHSSIFISFSASCRRMPFLSKGITP